MSWLVRGARVAAERDKMHRRKSVQGLAVARSNLGEITRSDCGSVTMIFLHIFIEFICLCFSY